MTKLGADERVLWEGTRAWSDFLGRWIGGIVFLVVGVVLLFSAEARPFGLWFIFVFLIFVITIWFARLSCRYTVTSQRVISRRGLISRNISEIEIKNIRDIRVEQGVLQRVFGIGSLALSSAGRAGAEVVFEGIADPDGVKEMIRSTVY
jgi:uncharacterized membrane protein YdbT with pleckstrin-like domain